MESIKNFTISLSKFVSCIEPKKLHFLGKMFSVLALFDKFSFVRTATAGHTSFTKNLFQMFHTHFFVIDWFTTFFTSIDGILQHKEEEKEKEDNDDEQQPQPQPPQKVSS